MTQAKALIDAAKTYADGKADAADEILDDAIKAVEWAQWTSFDLDPPSPISLTLPVELTHPPEPPEINIHDLASSDHAKPGNPPTLQDIDSIVSESVGVKPENKTEKPEFDAPDKPSQVDKFKDTAPKISNAFQVPTAPNWASFSAPILGQYTFPTAPQIMLPDAPDASIPDAPTAPADLAQTMQASYREAAPQFITLVNGYVDAELAKLNPEYHRQMARIEGQLTKYLDGGTGLKPEVEDAIYSRARAKNDVEAQRVQTSALADMAARGFTMPNGVGNSMMARARQEAANNNAKAANEIAIAQAEMEQKNLQFAVTTSTGLRTAMVGATMSYMQVLGQLNGQALQYSKAVLDAVVEAYNIAARAFAVRLEQVKTAVVIYDSQVKAALSQVELYRSKIAALQALTQVDQAKVAIYTAQLGSMQALAAVYKVQVDAALSQVEMEKARVSLFQAQVQAYNSEVQANTAEWQGYSAAISGEEAKMRAYNSEVQAFGAEVQAFSALVAAKKASLDGAVAVNQARSADFTHKVEAYRAVIQSNVEEMKGKVGAEAQKVAIFGMQLQDVAAQNELDSTVIKTEAAADTERYKAEWQRKTEAVKLSTAYQNTLATLHLANATIQGNLAGAALAGMNALAVESATE